MSQLVLLVTTGSWPISKTSISITGTVTPVWHWQLNVYCVLIFYIEWTNKWTLKIQWLRRKTGQCDGGGAEKILRRRDWSVDNFDVMEIRRDKSTKFDSARPRRHCRRSLITAVWNCLRKIFNWYGASIARFVYVSRASFVLRYFYANLNISW